MPQFLKPISHPLRSTATPFENNIKTNDFEKCLSKTNLYLPRLPLCWVGNDDFLRARQRFKELFQRFGPLKRFLYRPAGKEVALVEFIHPADALKALKNLHGSYCDCGNKHQLTVERQVPKKYMVCPKWISGSCSQTSNCNYLHYFSQEIYFSLAKLNCHRQTKQMTRSLIDFMKSSAHSTEDRISIGKDFMKLFSDLGQRNQALKIQQLISELKGDMTSSSSNNTFLNLVADQPYEAYSLAKKRASNSVSPLWKIAYDTFIRPKYCTECHQELDSFGRLCRACFTNKPKSRTPLLSPVKNEIDTGSVVSSTGLATPTIGAIPFKDVDDATSVGSITPRMLPLSMKPTLKTVLDEFKLTNLTEDLKEAGVNTFEDLKFLEHDDLSDIAHNKIELNKLRRIQKDYF